MKSSQISWYLRKIGLDIKSGGKLFSSLITFVHNIWDNFEEAEGRKASKEATHSYERTIHKCLSYSNISPCPQSLRGGPASIFTNIFMLSKRVLGLVGVSLHVLKFGTIRFHLEAILMISTRRAMELWDGGHYFSSQNYAKTWDDQCH